MPSPKAGRPSSSARQPKGPQAQPKSAGRPSSYSDEVAASLLSHIALGGIQADWCALPGNPCEVTIRRWAQTRPDFARLLARAREERADRLVDSAVSIIDAAAHTPEAVAKARAQADIRLRAAALLNPARYGQRVDLTVRDERPSLEDVEAKLTALARRLAGGTDAAATRH